VNSRAKVARIAKWSLLTNHARAMVCIARDPGVRLREIAVTLAITERSAHEIVRSMRCPRLRTLRA
jgi:hypothetical protein